MTVKGYWEASIKTVQHLAGLVPEQDVWSETGQLLIKYFGADLCVFGEAGDGGEVSLRDWTLSEGCSVSGSMAAAIREAVVETLDRGIPSTRIIVSPVRLFLAISPISTGKRIVSVMVAGHGMPGPFPDELLDAYLAVAGLAGTTALRLASELELRKRCRELERQVEGAAPATSQAAGTPRRENAEQKNAEEKLRAGEDLFSPIFAHMGIGVAVISPDMEILFLNQTMKQWFPHIDTDRNPICYRCFNDPPREDVCPYCPTLQALRDGELHISTTVTPTGAGHRIFRIIASPVLSSMGSISAVIEVVEDVTELKRADELNSLLAAIVESCDDAIISKTLDGIITSWNGGAEKVYGYSSDEATGRHVSMLFPAGKSDEWSGILERVASGMVITRYEASRVRKDGSEIQVSLSLSPIRDAAGAVVGVSTIAHDITGRKRADEQLRRLNAYNRSLIEASLDPLVTIGPDGRITDVNAATEEATGLRRKELIGTDFSDYFTDPEAARAGYMLVFRDGAVWDYPLEILHRQGRKTPVLYNATVYRDEAGAVIGVFAAARDITALRQAEDQLRRLNAYNRSLIEASIDPLVTIGPDGRINDVNLATEEVTGLGRRELIGTDFSDYFTDPGAARVGYIRVFRDGSVRDYPLEILHRDGHTTPVLYNATVYRDEAGSVIGVFAAARDITERRKAEAERLEMERRLLHSQKLESLGVLTGGIAHDFNNLLSVILGDLDLTLMAIPGDSQVRPGLLRALEASQRAASLIHQMLAYAGKGHFFLKEIALNEIVRANADLFRSSVARNITLEIIVEPELPDIKVDQGQIQQVIMNLIINASEAIGSNPGVITLRTGIRECSDVCPESWPDGKSGDGKFVFLEVSDTGCGMDEETRQRLFEPFFSTKFQGRGLGMSAVQGIVRSHHGAILLESEPGRGTTITVLFPCCRDESGAADSPPAPAEYPQGAEPLHGTVLIVDDEDLVRDLCMSFVGKLGLRPIGASDGHEAVRILRERFDEIDLVILDMTMPAMDGLHTLRELRRIRPGVRVIVSSGYSEDSMAEQFAGEMPAGFIHKPFKLTTLHGVITGILNQAAQLRVENNENPDCPGCPAAGHHGLDDAVHRLV